jgi:hypothetical protein
MFSVAICIIVGFDAAVTDTDSFVACEGKHGGDDTATQPSPTTTNAQRLLYA